MDIPSDPVRPLRGALLGCGEVSEHHLNAWAQVEGVQIVALYNRTPDKALRRAGQFGLPPEHVYTDLEALLGQETLDFVDIATAPSAHRAQVEAAAAHGVAVLCQKPLALSLDEAQAMREACQRAGVVLSVNENWRFRPWYREVKGLLERGVLGRLRYARFHKHCNITLARPDGSAPSFLSNQFYANQSDKLVVFEWGIHHIDVARFLFGEPQRVYARLDHASPYFEGDDRALVVLEYPQLTVLLDLSWGTTGDEPPKRQVPKRHGWVIQESFLVEGDRGLIEVLPEPENRFRLAAREDAWEHPVYTGDPYPTYLAGYIAAQRHFYECLRDGRRPETVVDDNLNTFKTTLAVYEAAALGQVIPIA
jgi:predicted dehydrogenase